MATAFFTALLAGVLAWNLTALAEEKELPSAAIVKYPYDLESLTVVGAPRWHQVRPKETLLDIARLYGLGYNEMVLLYPRMDPWLPPKRKNLMVPTLWVLPPTQHEELVINLPELRLYFFNKKEKTVQTYPIGIGDEGWETPLGTCRISEKRAHPTWYIPPSLQEKYGQKTMPPGPENPLGDYILKLSLGAYGIHGTSMPWGVGRLISHGCIRCYPEHIALLYPQVPIGTRLEIIYEPIKLGVKDGAIYVEVHPDVYRRIPDYQQYAEEKLKTFPYADNIDRERYFLAVKLQNGVPTNVSKPPEQVRASLAPPRMDP
ncbi:L,D-transpeptidase ErfK/SrfK [Desulfacinum hydrothermale DSM 13146]|uniref:L,D-transpeptidase ErfK/SrfK n=2 Tax=Desulfacinum hydrothermale TaxID=109258 RepID=A0A1W1X124_9BACT|nr:L,D-transpeptidase ErfK/SrfK [Desulfacinum hydrothermale DSM 13146]